jgi:hypothetical protein
LEAIEEGYMHGQYNDSPKSFHRFLRSSLRGFILSRLYIGTWNLEDYIQDFRLSYMKGSWVWHYYRWLERLKRKDALLEKLVNAKLTVFNSTSICIPFMLDALSEIRNRTKVEKEVFKQELPNIRNKMMYFGP